MLMDCDGGTRWIITQQVHRTTLTAWTTAKKTQFRHKTQKVHRPATLTKVTVVRVELRSEERSAELNKPMCFI